MVDVLWVRKIRTSGVYQVRETIPPPGVAFAALPENEALEDFPAR